MPNNPFDFSAGSPQRVEQSRRVKSQSPLLPHQRRGDGERPSTQRLGKQKTRNWAQPAVIVGIIAAGGLALLLVVSVVIGALHRSSGTTGDPEAGTKVAGGKTEDRKAPDKHRYYVEPKKPIDFKSYMSPFKVTLRGLVDYEQDNRFPDTTAFAFSPSSSHLVIGGRDKYGSGGFQFIDTATGRLDACVLNAHNRAFQMSEVIGLAFSPDGKYLATGCRFGRVKVWNVERLLKVANPTLRLSGSGEDTTQNVPTGLLVFESHVDTYHLSTLYADLHLIFSPNGAFLFAGAGIDCSPGIFGFLKCWRMPTGKEVFSKKVNGNVRSLALLPDNLLIGAAETNKCWNAASGDDVSKKLPFDGGQIASSGDRTRIGFQSYIENKKWERIGSKLVVVKSDGLSEVCVIDPQEGSRALDAFALSYTGRIIATAGYNDIKGHFIQLWYADSGTKIAEASNRVDGRTRLDHGLLAFSPDNKMLVIGSYDNQVLLFDLRSTD
jgi:WD40 repeat protein